MFSFRTWIRTHLTIGRHRKALRSSHSHRTGPLLEVLEEAPALADEQQQAAARVVVVLVRLEVLGEVLDALGEEGDLDLR